MDPELISKTTKSQSKKSFKSRPTSPKDTSNSISPYLHMSSKSYGKADTGSGEPANSLFTPNNNGNSLSSEGTLAAKENGGAYLFHKSSSSTKNHHSVQHEPQTSRHMPKTQSTLDDETSQFMSQKGARVTSREVGVGSVSQRHFTKGTDDQDVSSANTGKSSQTYADMHEHSESQTWYARFFEWVAMWLKRMFGNSQEEAPQNLFHQGPVAAHATY